MGQKEGRIGASRIVVGPIRCGDVRYSCVVPVDERNGARVAATVVGSSRLARERMRVIQSANRQDSTHVAGRSGWVPEQRSTMLRNWEESREVPLDKNK